MTKEDAAVSSLMQRVMSFQSSSKPAKPSPLAASTSAGEQKKPFRMVSPEDGEDLELTGNIISAACWSPYELGYRKGGQWELFTRRGASALNDSFKHIASAESKWKLTLVGWTGEIRELPAIPDPNTNGVGKQIPVAAPAMSRQKSYHVPPPIPVIEDDGNRMTMKGVYGKKKEDEKTKISPKHREELEVLLKQKGREGGWGDCVPVWLGVEEDGEMALGNVDRWRNYAERVIWPLFHYIVPQTFSPAEGSALEENSWWKDYLGFNNAFADRILEIYKPGDIVWVHDYHLLILPEILRQRAGKDIKIGLFVHAPWPTSEIFRVLSRRKPVVEGMLAANMVGFQSDTYRQHFISCCKRLLGYTETIDKEGRVTGVDTHGAHCAVEAIPIGIDANKVQAISRGAGIKEVMERIRKAYEGLKIIVGRDRLDSVRGVVQKLRAFECFLDRYPEWISKVVLIQVTSPSSLSQSSTIEHEVAELISHIQGKYGHLGFTPVQLYNQYIEPDEYFALLRAADLGLITSVRDGMNTTSLEYVVCQESSHGPVILSEFTGTAESLTNAVLVNPTNTKSVADAIAYCLEMSAADKKELHDILYHHVTTHTVQTWNSKFLKKLLAELAHHKANQATPILDRKLLLDAYNQAGEKGQVGGRLFMFDYDGTLTNIVTDPDMATPSDKVMRSIKKLAQDEKNQVWIISGRDAKFLKHWWGNIGELGLSAEHGCFMRMPGKDDWDNLVEAMDMSWQKVVVDIFSRYTERTQGSFIETKHVAVTWHYRRADPEHGLFQSKECHKELERVLAEKGYDVEVMTGKANLEVRPKFVNKGAIAKRLVESYPEGERPRFVLCVGDDTTDEDMFNALSASDLPPGDVFTVTVGPSSKVTAASYHLLEPSDVVDTVGLLTGSVTPTDVGVSEEVTKSNA